MLHLAAAEQPIVLILDQLDRLGPHFGGRQLFWLPSKLPRHVTALLSTLPDEEFECFPRLKVGDGVLCSITDDTLIDK